jgi:UDPglucose 6-dehydrogenase
MKTLKMAIVGHGFVGKAVEYGFSTPKVNIQLIDPLLKTTLHDINDNKDVVFVCVPTPMGVDGSINASILKEVVKGLYDLPFTKTSIIVIKSTVTPNILDELSKMDYNNQLVYNPEFLTENNANQDFINPIMHVFGGTEVRSQGLYDIYKKYSRCADCPTHFMSITEASLVKYGIYSFLATKVLWFNEFYDVVEKSNANYNTVINAIVADKRIGTSHVSVPGWDGKRGFGGPCFPKDSAAFYRYSKSLDVPHMTLCTAVTKNALEYRLKYAKLDDREIEQKVNFNIHLD